MTMSILGKRISYLRKKENLKQEELAQKVNVSKSSIGMYERGERNPDYETLQVLADFFQVSRAYLLGDTNNKNAESSEGNYDDDEQNEKAAIMNKIAEDFPDADLMFHDLANMTAEELEDVYDYIKFKQRKKD
ncbi:XRE family transcriptional regulator [Lentibacillus salicampi]|uniref:XRE family transcriptional regulator n=2 Tax=Lentibacillus salicampi TaxID=175306 RepID=A0A4Y9ABG5_9BACI|nr:XRE family transcriptional regulator [Lentibacillus salicampi]